MIAHAPLPFTKIKTSTPLVPVNGTKQLDEIYHCLARSLLTNELEVFIRYLFFHS